MILELLFVVVMAVISALTFYLPGAGQYPLYLPWGIDSVVQGAAAYFKAFEAVFPPVSIVMTAFLLYVGFRLSMLFLRLFIGHRAPNLD